MTIRLGPSVLDLVEQAHRRCRLAAVLGRLLLAEPGDDVAGVAASVPRLAPLAAADDGLAAEFERLLLREVPAYESVFLGDDGGRGGDVPRMVADVYAEHGFAETARWRVAGPDHLGLELRFFAHLCGEEAAAWSGDRPEEAARVVEAERAFLAEHLGRWGQVAAEAVRDRAGDSAYGALAEAVAELLADEAERLRPDPDHRGMPPVEVREPPDRLGPARLARWLLAPATCGAWLTADDLGAAARALGIPWRASDPRSRFRQAVEAAVDGGDVGALVQGLVPAIERWRDRHATLERDAPGAARTWHGWRRQAEVTLALIERLARGDDAPREAGPVVVVVAAPDAGARAAAAVDVLAFLRPLGARVAVSVELPPAIADAVCLLDHGADEVLLTGPAVSAVAFGDGGDAEEREVRHLGDADVVLRLRADAGPLAVTVEPGGDPVLAGEIRRSLAR